MSFSLGQTKLYVINRSPQSGVLSQTVYVSDAKRTERLLDGTSSPHTGHYRESPSLLYSIQGTCTYPQNRTRHTISYPILYLITNFYIIPPSHFPQLFPPPCIDAKLNGNILRPLTYIVCVITNYVLLDFKKFISNDSNPLILLTADDVPLSQSLIFGTKN